MERRSLDTPDDGSVSLELAVRLLRPHYPYVTVDEKPRLFPGRLPDDPAFEYPLTSRSSVARRSPPGAAGG